MASGGKRGAGERVLESKHVIGLFLLMLLFSGVFFTLGYVMGRNQFDGQVGAAMRTSNPPDPAFLPRNEPPPKKVVEDAPALADSDPSTSTSHSDWEYPATSMPAKSEPRLVPPPKASAPAPASKPVSVKASAPPVASSPAKASKVSTNPPLIANGAYVLQVAAMLKQDDALAVAAGLQKKHYAAFVQVPQKDKYYRVQVGPFKDQKAADSAKKGLESEGFKAFYVKH